MMRPPIRRTGSGRHHRGFSLVEILVVLAIIGTMAGIAIPSYVRTVEKARGDQAVRDLRMLQNSIDLFRVTHGRLPVDLAELGHGDLLDPWGSPYAYLDFSTVSGKGKMRKDRFLVPINSDYDLYSKGPDGDSKGPLTAKASRDDIIRAGDGSYIGPAEEY